ncbi:MAG: diacylglycerol/lipid kinase family protein [Lachnospiraceae bacterium]
MNRNETYYFIVNGNAGVGRKKNIWKHVLKPELIRRGVHYHQYECSYPGHGTKIATQILEEHPGDLTLVVVGGDGSFNEVLNGITDFSRVTLCYIPAGSANDLGYSLGISSDPLRALTQILDGGRIYDMDIGKTTFHRDKTSRYFAISSGIGLDAEACVSSGGRLKAALNRIHLGKLIYMINTVRSILSYPATEGKLVFVNANGELTERKVHRLFFLAGMNQPYEGGHLAMAAGAKSNDGRLSFAMAHDLGNVKALFSLALLALKLHERIPGYEVVDARACHVMLKDNLEVHTDGETFGKHWDVTIECLPKKLQLRL